MKISLIYGDGIGKEVIRSTKEVIESVTDKIEWEVVEAGEGAYKKEGSPLPEKTLDSIKKNKVAIKGPTATPVGQGFRSVNVEIRKKLNLYANYRPMKSFEGVDSVYKNLDIMIVRENTEGLYIGKERMIDENTAESVKIITKEASEKICKFAFEKAVEENRKKVTAAHKANIMKLSDGLFLDTFRDVSKNYSQIKSDDRIIDALCMELVSNPYKYDVIVAPNFYGDILSDLVAGLIGGLGYAPGANIGDDIAVFEAVHGTAPDIEGKNLANPTSAILSGVLMLKHIGLLKEADIITKGLELLFKDKNEKLQQNTKKFTEELIKKINKLS